MRGVSFIDNSVQWIIARTTRSTQNLVVALVVGILTGVAAAILKHMIGGVSHLLTSHFNADGPNFELLVIPIAGIVFTGILCRYVFKRDLEHGVERLINRISNNTPYIPRSLMFEPALASSITLGFGGSAGSEGPIAFTGAAIGSNVARAFNMDKATVMTMMGLGAGAGIAAIFKAPIGGALFTIEVLRIALTTTGVFALIICCVASAMTAYCLSGFTWDVHWVEVTPFDIHTLPWIIALGIFCGFYSFYYAKVMKLLAKKYVLIKNQWIRNIASGAVLAVILFLFPALYGEGYGVIGKVINGDSAPLFSDSLWWAGSSRAWVLILVTLGALLSKCWAAGSSNCGGGVAGDFAPTLFAGCLAGLLFATCVNTWFGADVSVANFSMIGMAAVMSGAIRAPMMAIFLTTEMTAAYSFFLPVIVAVALSFAIVKALTPGSFYPVHKYES